MTRPSGDQGPSNVVSTLEKPSAMSAIEHRDAIVAPSDAVMERAAIMARGLRWHRSQSSCSERRRDKDIRWNACHRSAVAMAALSIAKRLRGILQSGWYRPWSRGR